jgi:hypothetical protein
VTFVDVTCQLKQSTVAIFIEANGATVFTPRVPVKLQYVFSKFSIQRALTIADWTRQLDLFHDGGVFIVIKRTRCAVIERIQNRAMSVFYSRRERHAATNLLHRIFLFFKAIILKKSSLQ